MKKLFSIIVATSLIAAGIAACKSKAPQTPETKAPQATAIAPPISESPAGQPAMPAPVQFKTGKVLETMNSGGYTYVQVDTGAEKFWAATPQFSVKIGEKVTVPAGMPMTNFKSNSLNRTFDLVYFVQAIGKGDQAPSTASVSSMPGMAQPAMQQHPKVDTSKAAKDANISFAGIVKPAGGKSVDEIFVGQSNLSGKEVTVRGKVVKFSPGIMGKNWIHLQDGTGKEGSNDLTITTDTTAKVGDTILVKGVVSTNKDFGFGYKYNVIIENAQVTVE